jgi:hypothetical protein
VPEAGEGDWQRENGYDSIIESQIIQLKNDQMISKEDAHDEYIKRYSTLLVIKEIQIKTHNERLLHTYYDD